MLAIGVYAGLFRIRKQKKIDAEISECENAIHSVDSFNLQVRFLFINLPLTSKITRKIEILPKNNLNTQFCVKFQLVRGAEMFYVK